MKKQEPDEDLRVVFVVLSCQYVVLVASRSLHFMTHWLYRGIHNMMPFAVDSRALSEMRAERKVNWKAWLRGHIASGVSI